MTPDTRQSSSLCDCPHVEGRPPAYHAIDCPLEDAMSDGIALIAAERKRQVEREGWTPEHDDEHTGGQLAQAARGYLGAPGAVWDRPTGVFGGATPMGWPFEDSAFKPTGDAVRDLVKAGALIAAEIDRLQRRGDA